MTLRIAALAYTHYESDPRVRREAEALAGRGDEVTVFALRGEGQPRESVVAGVRVVRIDQARYRGGRAGSYLLSYGRFFAEAGVRLALAHLSLPFDVVHVHTMPDFMVFAAALPALAGAKVLLDMHDLMPDLYALKFDLDRDGRAVRLLRAVERASAGFADAVLCVHEPQYRLLLRDGIPARKLGIVMNTADPRLFPRRAKEPRIDDAVWAVYHGTVLHRYGLDLAVRALAEARKSEPRLRMKILGDGDFVPVLRTLADELGLTEGVLEIGGQRLPLDAMAEAIRDAHFGVVPNRDDQEDSVLPTKMLEYIAVGIPVVATATRCVTHYFGPEHAELVPVGDVSALSEAMVSLARDGKRRAALTKAAAGWQDEFGHSAQMRLLFRTVDALCAEKVKEQKRKKQEAVEGVKTGKRETPPKSEPETRSAPQNGVQPRS